MKRPVIVWIDAEDEKCGECDSLEAAAGRCRTFDCCPRTGVDLRWMRCPVCLNAGKKLRELVEAGKSMRKNWVYNTGPSAADADAWDRALALAAIMEER